MPNRILSVPFLTQPDNDTCQATCLKMYALYLEQQMRMSVAAAQQSIFEIHKEVKSDLHTDLAIWNRVIGIELTSSEPMEMRFTFSKAAYDEDGPPESTVNLSVSVPKAHEEEARSIVATLLPP